MFKLKTPSSIQKAFNWKNYSSNLIIAKNDRNNEVNSDNDCTIINDDTEKVQIILIILVPMFYIMLTTTLIRLLIN